MPYFPPASSSSVTPPFRNRLINGAWRFDQAKEGTAYSFSGSTGQAMDCWSGAATGAGTFTMTRVADPDNASLFALKVACTVADASIGAADDYHIWTTIEGYDVADLKIGTASAAQITISFDMKFDVAGQYGVWIQNSAVNRGYLGTVTQNVASANESKTVTLTLDTTGTWLYTNGIGLTLGFTLAAGSNDQGTAGVWSASTQVLATSSQCNFMSANTNVGYIKRIQLESGATATTFENLSVAAEQARIDRYYKVLCATGDATQVICSGYCAGTTFPEPVITLAVPMCNVPALVISAAAHFSVFPTGTVLSGLAINAGGYSTNKAILLDGTVAGGLTTGNAIALAATNASAFLALNARLS